MPDVKFYCPEEKSEVIPSFRMKYGKDWGKRIVELIESDNSSAELKNEPQENQAEIIYQRIFGDIKNENEFISDFGRVNSAAAVKGRLDIVFTKYRNQYVEVIELLKEKLPKLAKLGELL